MKWFALVLAFVIAGSMSVHAGTQGAAPSKKPVVADRDRGAVPQKALDVYNYVILHGRPPEGIVGGAVWHNRERHLPRGHYREFDVNPRKKGVNRGPERIVINMDTNNGWYTADHYRTFVPIPSTHLKEQGNGKQGFHNFGP